MRAAAPPRALFLPASRRSVLLSRPSMPSSDQKDRAAPHCAPQCVEHPSGRDDLPPSLVFNALIVLLPASIVPPCIAPVRAAELSLQLTRLCSDLASDGTSSRSE